MSQRYILVLGLTVLSLLLPLCGYASIPHIPISSTPVNLFIEQVWQTNPSIQSAEAEVNAAIANASALERPLYNPELEFDGERVRNDSQEDTYTIGVSQTIDLFGKRRANRQVGQSILSETQAALAAKKLSVGIAALTALREFNTAQQVTDLAAKRTQLLKKFVQLTEKKYAAGDLGQAALDQSRLALSEAIALQASTEIFLSNAKEALAAITNRTADVWPTLLNDLPDPPQLPKDLTVLLQQLPSIQILNYRASTAKARIKVAKTNTRPDPTISLRGGQEDQKALIGLNLRMPLFVRNNFQDQVIRANQEATAIYKMRLNAYWQAKARLQGTASRYDLLYRAYKEWSNVSAGSLNRGIILLDKLWVAGEINTTDYLIQLKQRIDSQIAGSELLGQTWQAWIFWLDASGNLDHWLGCSVQP